MRPWTLIEGEALPAYVAIARERLADAEAKACSVADLL